ncbi:MAG TPA: aldo/keto reductase [Thermoanaerobaculaceae bacterium]|nr:aldo/keto reductase [Thermoanaerobaculaceae bacterium]
MSQHDDSRDRDDDSTPIERRDLFKIGTAATVGFLARGMSGEARAGVPPLPSNPVTPKAMPTRNLGRTGYRVGIFSLGGQAAVEQPDNDAVAVPIVERALDLGVNYVDTSARYGGEARWSERYIGQVMKRRRREAFLATKTHDRTRDGSRRLLEKSLTLLQTDHVDLWQVHNLAHKEEVEQIFAPGGAVEALVKAREQGIVRFVGVTGHAAPDVLLEAIRRFPFDTVLMALNAADRHHLSFRRELLPAAVEREMGIIGMKIPARGRILAGWTPPPPEQQKFGPPATRPGTLTMREAIRFTLSLPVSTVIVGCDTVAQLEENVQLARSFTPLTEAQMGELEVRTEPVMRQALFFRRWDA